MNQRSQYSQPSPEPLYRGDELNLKELWKVLVEYKFLIITITILTTLSVIYYTSTMPTVYKAQVLMLPSSGGSSGSSFSSGKLGGLASMAGISLGGSTAGIEGEQALARLKTRSFLVDHIKEKNLKPILFANRWNEQSKIWLDEAPSDREASELLLDMIIISMNPEDRAGLVTFSLEWKNPDNSNKIADIANGLVSDINFKAKQRANLEAKNSISFLEKELEHTSILNSQTILYSMIEQQIHKIMIANIRDEFVFKIIDPAVIPERAESKPTLMIILIGIVLAIFLGSFLAVSINYFKEQSEEILTTSTSV